MKQCSNCYKTHGPLKRYMWNIDHDKGKTEYKSGQGLLCEACAKSKGAWQTRGQLTQQDEDQQAFEREIFGGINDIIERRTN